MSRGLPDGAGRSGCSTRSCCPASKSSSSSKASRSRAACTTAGLNVTAGDLRRTDTYLKADLTPGTCVIVEDNGRRSLQQGARSDPRRRRHAGLRARRRHRRTRASARTSSSAQFPELNYLALSELFGGPLLTEFSRSLTRLRVQQYQRFFSDADRVLILLHNDPDPDAMASGLALRNVLRRTKQTAIIGALQGVTRPENLRMVNLLDIHVEIITAGAAQGLRPDRDGRRAAALLRRRASTASTWSSIIIPSSPATRAVFKDIRADYGSTSTILTEHLRAVDVNISERTATAMLYAIKSDTLFFNRQANRVDIEAFSYLYPLADADADPQDGRRGNHDRAARLRDQGAAARAAWSSRCSARSSASRRARTSSPTSPTSTCSSRTCKWTIIAGIVNDTLVMSVRNLGYSRNAGEFVRQATSTTSAAPAATARWPRRSCRSRAFREKFGNLQADEFTDKVLALALEFLHEHQPNDRKLVKA